MSNLSGGIEYLNQRCHFSLRSTHDTTQVSQIVRVNGDRSLQAFALINTLQHKMTCSISYPTPWNLPIYGWFLLMGPMNHEWRQPWHTSAERDEHKHLKRHIYPDPESLGSVFVVFVVIIRTLFGGRGTVHICCLPVILLDTNANVLTHKDHAPNPYFTPS